MEGLTAAVGESCSVSVLDGEDIVYVLRVPMEKIMSINLGVGSRLPAHCTSMGRVLLAGLPEEQREARVAAMKLEALTPRTITDPAELLDTLSQVRRQGFALVDEELQLGLMSLAVPIKDRSGRVMAAINVSSPAQRQSAAEMQASCLPALQSVAERIAAMLPR
jgi:IclR family pca regulon transcriptional regulator